MLRLQPPGASPQAPPEENQRHQPEPHGAEEQTKHERQPDRPSSLAARQLPNRHRERKQSKSRERWREQKNNCCTNFAGAIHPAIVDGIGPASQGRKVCKLARNFAADATEKIANAEKPGSFSPAPVLRNDPNCSVKPDPFPVNVVL